MSPVEAAERQIEQYQAMTGEQRLRIALDLHEFACNVNILYEQSALKADFWLLRENDFETMAFGRRTQVTLFDVSAWIATAEDVILHKLYWNSLAPSDRQLGDAAGVYAVQGSALNLNYLRHWAALLHVQRELDSLVEGRIKPKQT
jgi:hypothetical protein